MWVYIKPMSARIGPRAEVWTRLVSVHKCTKPCVFASVSRAAEKTESESLSVFLSHSMWEHLKISL